MDEEPFTPGLLRAALAGLPPVRRYRVAYSGGLDSHALLHAFRIIQPELGCASLDALHVNHRLHPDADDWATHCRRVCTDLGVPVRVFEVDAGAGTGESPEAAARAARYRALAGVLDAGDVLCTAHHRDDQVETLLLRLVRGAGVRGLRGMQASRQLGHGRLARPLLAVSRSALEDYARDHRLKTVADPSNEALRYDRNFVRLEILPRLQARWPGLGRTLERAIAHQGEALVLLDSLAEADLERTGGTRRDALSRARLRELSPERGCNCLRYWVGIRGLPPPADVHVHRVLEDLVHREGEARGCVSWPGAQVRVYRDDLYAMAPLPPHDAAQIRPWQPPETLEFGHGRLRARPVGEGGLDPRRAEKANVEVRFRRGGERCRPCGRAHGQRLKKLLQEYSVPPWQRERIPLVYVEGELAAVAGLWVCEGFQTPPGAAGWALHWEAN